MSARALVYGVYPMYPHFPLLPIAVFYAPLYAPHIVISKSDNAMGENGKPLYMGYTPYTPGRKRASYCGFAPFRRADRARADRPGISHHLETSGIPW